MSAHLRAALFLLMTAVCAAGQTVDRSFPLTNTRYGMARGSARLVTDGKDSYLFWRTESNIRMTKLAPGEARVGRPVLPIALDWTSAFDVVWTGRYFLIAAVSGSRIVGGLASTQAEPVGEPFQLATNARGEPRLAFTGTYVLLAYKPQPTFTGIIARRLTAEGRFLGDAVEIGNNVQAFDVTTNGNGFAVLVANPGGDRLVLLDSTAVIRSDQSLGGRSTSLRIASDGLGYRAVGVTQEGRTWSATFQQDGSLRTTIALDDALAVTSLVWTGNGYTAAFRESY